MRQEKEKKDEDGWQVNCYSDNIGTAQQIQKIIGLCEFKGETGYNFQHLKGWRLQGHRLAPREKV